MSEIQLTSLFLNFIIYSIFIILNIIIILFNKNFNSKKNIIKTLITCTIINVILSLILYSSTRFIFTIFKVSPGIINHAIYSSKILFITSSLFAFNVLTPITLLKTNQQKKSAILVLSKIAVTIFTMFIGYHLFDFKGLLYSFPLINIIFVCIYFYYILKITR